MLHRRPPTGQSRSSSDGRRTPARPGADARSISGQCRRSRAVVVRRDAAHSTPQAAESGQCRGEAALPAAQPTIDRPQHRQQLTPDGRAGSNATRAHSGNTGGASTRQPHPQHASQRHAALRSHPLADDCSGTDSDHEPEAQAAYHAQCRARVPPQRVSRAAARGGTLALLLLCLFGMALPAMRSVQRVLPGLALQSLASSQLSSSPDAGGTVPATGVSRSRTDSPAGSSRNSSPARTGSPAGRTRNSSPARTGSPAGRRRTASPTKGGDRLPPPLLTGPGASREWDPNATVRVATIVPGGVLSPYKEVWAKVMSHISQRVAWTDPTFQLMVFTEAELAAQGESGEEAWAGFLRLMQQGCQVLVGGALGDPALVTRLTQAAGQRRLPGVRAFLGDAAIPVPPQLEPLTTLSGFKPQAPSLVDQALLQLLPWSGPAKGLELWGTLQALWGRHTSDDLLFVFLVLINQYVTPVKEVAMTTKGSDLASLRCMLTNCREQIFACVGHPTCKAALDCLQACSFNDQVCQYRCIVSYETPELAAFTLCILQKHNCRNLDAQPPTRPDPAPMASFRGVPLTHAAAEDLLLGWISRPDNLALEPNQQLPFSWLVAAGKNPAYDFFPCQHQLFWRGRGGVMWYEPVFKAITLDGQEVWRRRKYRVRRGPVPGTFNFTVLDNGITSKEFWRILDCDNRLGWCLFYYSGAASAAGLSYSGAVLGSRDGAYPSTPDAVTRIEAALGRAGIQPWELSFVDNTACEGADLSLAAAA